MCVCKYINVCVCAFGGFVCVCAFGVFVCVFECISVCVCVCVCVLYVCLCAYVNHVKSKNLYKIRAHCFFLFGL